jgi:hypothetical protein
LEKDYFPNGLTWFNVGRSASLGNIQEIGCSLAPGTTNYFIYDNSYLTGQLQASTGGAVSADKIFLQSLASENATFYIGGSKTSNSPAVFRVIPMSNSSGAHDTVYYQMGTAWEIGDIPSKFSAVNANVMVVSNNLITVSNGLTTVSNGLNSVSNLVSTATNANNKVFTGSTGFNTNTAGSTADFVYSGSSGVIARFFAMAGGAVLSAIDGSGGFGGASFYYLPNYLSGSFSMNSGNGMLMYRSIADANPVFEIRNYNTNNTGYLQSFLATVGGSVVSAIDQNGTIYGKNLGSTGWPWTSLYTTNLTVSGIVSGNIVSSNVCLAQLTRFVTNSTTPAAASTDITNWSGSLTSGGYVANSALGIITNSVAGLHRISWYVSLNLNASGRVNVYTNGVLAGFGTGGFFTTDTSAGADRGAGGFVYANLSLSNAVTLRATGGTAWQSGQFSVELVK